MHGSPSQRRDRWKSYAGSEMRWGDEDGDGGAVDYVTAVTGGHSQDWVEGLTRSPTSWGRHRLHDLGGEVNKHRTSGSKHGRKWDELVEGCGSWALELNPRPVGQSKALPAPLKL